LPFVNKVLALVLALFLPQPSQPGGTRKTAGTMSIRKLGPQNPESSLGCLGKHEDRKTGGLILDHTIRNNYTLPSLNRLSTFGVVHHNRLDVESGEYMGRLNIKAPDMRTFARNLSGGNCQKTVAAK
jgi:ABC-type sugar transport system ATPase subunit